MRMTHPPRRAGFGSGHHRSSRTYRLWSVVCVLTSVWVQERSSIEWSAKCTFHVQALHLVFHGEGCAWLPASV
eukprot:3416915-Amphidinium_carterae.1